MNLRNIFSVILLTINMLSACAQEPADTYTQKLPGHPRILLFEGEEEALKATVLKDPLLKSVHDIIINDCNLLVSKPPVERVLIGRRLLDKSREALRRIFSLSYAYRMTGERKYFERAEQELLAVSAFTDWNPSHFLDVAEMTMAASIGYDWLFNELSQESRTVIKEAIIAKGINPSLDSKYNGWLKATHNWNQVCNAGITYGALAVFEENPSLAARLISRAEESIKLPMEDYNPDGAYPEGYGYWGYGTSFNVMFISAWEKAFGRKFDVPQNEAFLKTAQYMVNMTGPTGQNFNYSDNGSGAGLHPAMFWLASRSGNGSVLFAEKKFLGSLKNAGDRLLPAIMIWGKDTRFSEIETPSALLWTGKGKNPVALMRSSWTDPNAIFVGFKAGSPAVNHGHMDVGSFVMDADGIRWAMDFGAQDYNSLESKGVNLWGMAQNSQRWEVFRYNNFVHNTLTVNGKLQLVSGKTDIKGTSSGAGFLAAAADLTPVYSDQLKSSVRGIAIVEGKYVAVRDEVETKESETVVKWSLLTSAEVTVTGPNSAELSKNGKKLVLTVSAPATVVMKTWPTDPVHDYDAPNPGTVMIGFEATVPANTKSVLQVFLVPGSNEGIVPSDPGSISSWNLK